MLLVNCNSGRHVPHKCTRGAVWRRPAVHVTGYDTPRLRPSRHLFWRAPKLYPTFAADSATSDITDNAPEKAPESDKDPSTVLEPVTDRDRGTTVAPKRNKPRKKRRFTFFILACLAILVSILWVQRYPIIENYARSKLAAQGITGKLSLRHISKNHAVIDNIHLESEAGPFFSAKTVEVDYNWREALKGNVNALRVSDPELSISIDQNGVITSDWLPQSHAGSKSSINFPRDGISIDHGTLILQTPFGDYQTYIDAKTTSPSHITATLKATPQLLLFKDFGALIGGHIDLSLLGETLTYDARIQAPSLNLQAYKFSDVSIEWSAATDPKKILEELTSRITVNFKQFTSDDVMAKRGEFIWDGTLTAPGPEKVYPHANGVWQARVDKAGIVNDDRRERLAQSVTLSETLMKISASAPFSPGLTSVIETLLAENQIDAAGTLQLNEAGAKLSLSRPAHIKGAKNKLQLKEHSENHPFFVYEASTEALKVSFDGDLEGPFAASIQQGELVAKIENGRHFSNVMSFAADFRTHRTWHAQTSDGRPARLAPMRANITYDATHPTRSVRLAGRVDYDGDVPGGYATGVKARGVMDLRLRDNSLSARFTPVAQTPIYIDRLETATDWILDQIKFELIDTGPQYQRSGDSRIEAGINSAQARISHRREPRDLYLQFTHADVTGHLRDPIQDWTISAKGAEIKSDTFPTTGTVVRSDNAVLRATLSPGTPVSFDVESPSAQIKTSLVQASHMAVTAKGTPGEFTVDYGRFPLSEAGLVKFSAGQLPIVPVKGDAVYKDGSWIGQAVTTLPKSGDTPINIDYKFEGGLGSAHVKIANLPFSPSRLQPQQLIPALSGKISRVDGFVSANIDLSFGVGQPLRSSGTAVIRNLSAATLPGPFSGLNGDLHFSSFFPLQTDGDQTLTLDSFDPGFPLEDGTFRFEIIPDGVKIQSAEWPLGTGRISLDPTSWLYSAPQNRVRLRVDNVSLGEFLDNVGGGNLSATGDVSGVLPVLIEGVKVHVEDGRLAVKNGGIIEYHSPQTEAAANSNEYAGYAFDALKHFEYEELEALLNGPLDGPMLLRMKFNGSNPDVLYGTEFKFNVGVEGELLNILRSFQMGDAISAKILEAIEERDPETPGDPDP